MYKLPHITDVFSEAANDDVKVQCLSMLLRMVPRRRHDELNLKLLEIFEHVY